MDHVLQQLSKPFPAAHISWLPGAIMKDKAKCLAMAYADLRAYQNRLDEICGLQWAVTYTPWNDRVICHITVSGVTRSSTGEAEGGGNAGTSAEAQAFKRACAMFGLGRYLYDLPSVWVEYDDSRRAITDTALATLNERYARWYAKAIAKYAAPPEGQPEAQE